MKVFDDPIHQENFEFLLGFAPYGGADIGELDQIATAVSPGDDGSFHDALRAFAERRIGQGDDLAASGHEASARAAYLRAAAMLGCAYRPLFGTPVDPRLVSAFQLQQATIAKYFALGDPPAQELSIPYEGTHQPGWFVPAPGSGGERRPVIIVGGGWDSTLVDNYLGIGVAALERGYHIVLHDGPGQGKLLYEEGLPLRHDWEHVMTPVVDAVLELDGIDPDGIVYVPWSLGGYMAPRAAAFEHRFAAVVADPGQKFIPVGKNIGMMLSPEAAAKLPELSAEDEANCMAFINGDRTLHWSLVQRGFWANGASDLSSFIAEMDRWALDDETIAQITCPILVLSADGDRASTTTDELDAAITAPKARRNFTAADGAAQHCESLNRSMANGVIFDWIDDTLAAAKRR